jgi:hypothetical protein
MARIGGMLAAASLGALLAGCAVAPPIPSFSGPVADVEIMTATLKSRDVSNPEESARFTVYRKSGHELIGSEALTVHEHQKLVKLPAGIELEFRFFKITESLGENLSCVADYVMTLVPRHRYRVVFDFDFNYDVPRASTCTSEIQHLDADGHLVQRVPPETLKMPLF